MKKISVDGWICTEDEASFKTLNMDGEELLYRKTCDGNDHDHFWDTTTFYVPGPKVEATKWSWRKLKRVGTGEMVESFKETFSVNFWIETSSKTKGYVKDKIKHSMELCGRASEIKRGEIGEFSYV